MPENDQMTAHVRAAGRRDDPVMRAFAVLAAVFMIAGALAVAAFALLIASLELSDNPCGLGDDPCTADTGDRFIGWIAAIGGTATVGFALAAAVSALTYAAKRTGVWIRRWGRFTVLAFGILLVGFFAISLIGR